MASLAAEHPTVTAVVNGVIGPCGDGYVVGATMAASEAAAYHGLQARAFAEAGAAMISAITMTYPDEAIGIVRAATVVNLGAVISFTVETDGRLPCGLSIAEAIERRRAGHRQRPRVLHAQLRAPHALPRPPRRRRRLDDAHQGRPRQRLPAQPRRARRRDRPGPR